MVDREDPGDAALRAEVDLLDRLLDDLPLGLLTVLERQDRVLRTTNGLAVLRRRRRALAPPRRRERPRRIGRCETGTAAGGRAGALRRRSARAFGSAIRNRPGRRAWSCASSRLRRARRSRHFGRSRFVGLWSFSCRRPFVEPSSRPSFERPPEPASLPRRTGPGLRCRWDRAARRGSRARRARRRPARAARAHGVASISNAVDRGGAVDLFRFLLEVDPGLRVGELRRNESLRASRAPGQDAAPLGPSVPLLDHLRAQLRLLLR